MAAVATVNSVSLNDTDFGGPANGFLDGVLLNRYKAVINISFTKQCGSLTPGQGKRLQFIASSKTIVNANSVDTDSFITTDGWSVGDKIINLGTITNTGIFTIASVSDRVITVVETVVNELAESCLINLTSKITAIDLFYNLIANNEAESYFSKTDTQNIQRYTATGLDTTVVTPVSFLIGSSSNAWVTDTLSGNVSQATIAGSNTSFGSGGNYVQKFTITQYFFQAPFFLTTYLPNFQNNTPPPNYTGQGSTAASINGLKYICNVACKLVAGATIEAQGNWIEPDGVAAWLNQNNSRTAPEFTLVSTSYVDDATGLPLPAIDFTKTNDVTIVINSESGLFKAPPVNPFLGFISSAPGTNPFTITGTGTAYDQTYTYLAAYGPTQIQLPLHIFSSPTWLYGTMTQVGTATTYTGFFLVTPHMAGDSITVPGGSLVVLNHLYCSINEADYQNTSTTLRQNSMHDRALLYAGSGAVNGEFFGTNYSIIQNAVATVNSVNQITITFKAIYTAALQAYLIARPGNRNYGFIPITQ